MSFQTGKSCCAILESIRFDLNENSVLAPHRYVVFVQIKRIFSKMATRWRRGDELLNSLFFFAYKKYSCSLITLRLSHWWQMDYFDNVFYAFLNLTVLIVWQSMGVTSLPLFIPNILNCVPKTNKAFRGLERHGGVINNKIFILGWSNPFRIMDVYGGYMVFLSDITPLQKSTVAPWYSTRIRWQYPMFFF